MTDGVRLSELLPDNLDGIEQAIEGDLDGGKRGGLSTMAWRCVRSSAAAEVRKALDFDVFILLAQAWAKARELHACVGKPADETTVISLGAHDLKHAVYPDLILDFGTPPHPTVRFTVEVAAHFEGAVLSIRNGHITSVETGNASATAEFKYKTVRLHKEESPKVKISGTHVFAAPGIRIA